MALRAIGCEVRGQEHENAGVYEQEERELVHQAHRGGLHVLRKGRGSSGRSAGEAVR